MGQARLQDASLMDMRQTTAAKLASARKGTGLSTRAVANLLLPRYQVSHATIANYEKGASSPPLEILAALANVYQRPLNWFLHRGIELTNVRYRNLTSKVKVSDRHRFESEVQRWLEGYVAIESRLGERLVNEFPKFRRTSKDSPADLSRRVRSELGFADEILPIPSVVDALHRFGIRVIEQPTELRIDGLAGMFGSEHAVVLNPSAPNDRSRMNAAHELGHILLGDCSHSAAATKDEENQAFEFASTLLLPNRALKAAFEGQSMVRLVKYKERFGISLAAMVYRAEKLQIITKAVAKRLWIEFAKRGWRTAEPGDVRPDRATRFEEMLDSAFASNKLTPRDAANLAGVRTEELRNRIDLAAGIRPEDDSPSILSISDPV